MGKKVIIIGGGVAGMQTAITLSKLGISPVIIEREETIGGKLNRWDRLFPTMTPASEVLGSLREQVDASGAEILTSREVKEIGQEGKNVTLNDGTRLRSDAVVVTSGFDLFPAELKEEYGYKIYDNVYTTVDVERMFRNGGIRTADGRDVYSSYERGDTLRTTLGGLLKGMKESVKLVGRGGKINAWIPSSAAYGTEGDKELGIQPNTTLYYEIELVDVDKYANWSRRSNLRR